MNPRKLNAADVKRLRGIASELREMQERHRRSDARLELAARHVDASAAEINQAIVILGNLIKSAPKAPRRAEVPS